MLTNVNGVNQPDQAVRGQGVVPRRERVRAATEAEILGTARELLVEAGPTSVTLREVGRRMGMTASALYRYFDGHAALFDALVAACYDELTDAVTRSVVRPADVAARGAERAMQDIGLAARAFRRWSLANKAEFGLMFGSRDPRVGELHPGLTSDACMRFEQAFARLFASGLPEPVADVTAAAGLFAGLPHPIDVLFARGWVRLLGTVSVEAFGHADYLPMTGEELFETELQDCAGFIVQGLLAHRAGVVRRPAGQSAQ
jgi:AcrR family transcriptional regulator